MAALNLLVQLVGIIAGLYLMVSRSFGEGVALVALIAGGHLAFTKLSELLMLVHQKMLPADEVRELQLRAYVGQFGDPAETTPPAWKAIATVCGCLYFCAACGAIWYFLVGW